MIIMQKMIVHPGLIIKSYLTQGQITSSFAAQKIGMHSSQFCDILNGKRDLNSRVALLLEQEFGYSARELMHLQAEFDLEKERNILTKQGLLP